MSIQKCKIRSRQNTSILSFYRPPTLTPLNDYDPRKILKAGLAGDVERHPSVVNIASKQRTTRNILETLEAKLNHLVQVIPNIASAIEEKFNDSLATVSKMPAASGEETMDKILRNLNEYPSSLLWPVRRNLISILLVCSEGLIS